MAADKADVRGASGSWLSATARGAGQRVAGRFNSISFLRHRLKPCPDTNRILETRSSPGGAELGLPACLQPVLRTLTSSRHAGLIANG